MLTVSLFTRAHRDRCISDEQYDVKTIEYSISHKTYTMSSDKCFVPGASARVRPVRCYTDECGVAAIVFDIIVSNELQVEGFDRENLANTKNLYMSQQILTIAKAISKDFRFYHVPRRACDNSDKHVHLSCSLGCVSWLFCQHMMIYN